MDNKDNLDGSSTNDDPGFRGNSNTSNNQQAFSDTHASRVSLILVTRDPLDKPADEVTNTMDNKGRTLGVADFGLVEKDGLCAIMTSIAGVDSGSRVFPFDSLSYS